MAACWAAKDSEFVLQAHNIDIADIEEVRGAQIGRKILFFNLEANDIRVIIALFDVVHRDRKALAGRVFVSHRGKQVGSKCCDAALTRQIVPDESNPSDFRTFDHDILPYAPGGLVSVLPRFVAHAFGLLKRIPPVCGARNFLHQLGPSWKRQASSWMTDESLAGSRPFWLGPLGRTVSWPENS